MIRILVVEDDSMLAGELKRHLEKWGYDVLCAREFSSVMGEFDSYSPQLVLMDISLPFFNGYHRCHMIRSVSNVPIIFLSSSADNMNIVMAINMGGDDFVAKPFDMNVLTAKIQALLRRSYEFTADNNSLRDGLCGDGRIYISGNDSIEHGVTAILNTGDATLTVNGERIALSMNEYRILQILAENRRKSVSRDAIMERLWQTDEYIDDNTLTVNITRLRKKLEAAGLEGIIETKRKMGYMLK